MILSVKASINNDAGHTGLCVLFADDMGRHFLDVTQFMRGSKRVHGVWTPLFLEIKKVAICFLRNTGTDPLEKQMDLSGDPRDLWGQFASRGRPSVKYVDD